jgi:DNA polymerase sigma
MEKRYETNLKEQSMSMNEPRHVHTRHNFYWIQDILHNEILLFKQDANSILIEMQQVKEILIMKIQQVVKRVFQNYRVDVYGSHATGLCLHWSDIDLVVGAAEDKDIPQMMQEVKIKDALRRISDSLSLEI